MRLQTLSGKSPVMSDRELAIAMKAFVAKATNMPQEGFHYVHHMGGGVYIREMHLKPGTIGVGVKHLKETMAMIIKGTIKVFTDEGVRTYTAPAVIVSPPGSQRIVYAVDDAIFSTFHPSEGRTVEEIEIAWTGEAMAPHLLGRAGNVQALRSEALHEKAKLISS
jgi:hypothetical protein